MVVLRSVLSMLVCSGLAYGQLGDEYKAAPIHYDRPTTNDPIAKLVERIAKAEVVLERDEHSGFLTSLLRALDVPISSQGLVFSKTSFQNRIISPQNPRALYFGDEVYVGYVPGGGVLEITAMDPEQGPIFYTLDQRKDHAEFTRQADSCLRCHGTARTEGWPGNLIRSVHPDRAGNPTVRLGSFVTTQDSPFAQRWGGWYVTGTHGELRHLGNATFALDARPSRLDLDSGANVTDLSDRFDTRRYPSPHSDIVALMVLEHQTQMHNLIARASYRVRRALYLQAEINKALGDDEDYVSDATRSVLKDAAGDLVEYMLFKHEARLPSEVRGTSKFAEEFAKRGPRDSSGRSLRELDLTTRLFRYPCSYLIYSPAFDALPAPVLGRVYTRLWRVLTGKFGRRAWKLPRETRQAILDILLATKRGLPDYWKPVTVR